VNRKRFGPAVPADERIQRSSPAGIRRGVRAVEGARLESVCGGNSTPGSNPGLSATLPAPAGGIEEPGGVRSFGRLEPPITWALGGSCGVDDRVLRMVAL
jgi:hypothetical protein